MINEYTESCCAEETQPVAQEDRIPDVWSEIEQCKRECRMVEDVICTLREKIAPVLRESLPTCGEAKEKDQEATTSVGKELRTISNDMRAYRYELMDLRERIEL